MQLADVQFTTYIWCKPGSKSVNLAEVVAIHSAWGVVEIAHHDGQLDTIPPSELSPKPREILEHASFDCAQDAKVARKPRSALVQSVSA